MSNNPADSTRPGYFEEELKEEADAEMGDLQETTTSPEDKSGKRWVLIRATLGEFLVTFLFIYIVTATAINMKRKDINNPVAGCLVTAFSAVALIYSFADVSGAHFNPSVTFATLVTGKMSLLKAALFWIAQLSGATCSALFLTATFPDIAGHNTMADIQEYVILRPKTAHVSLWFSFLMEFFLTFVLVYVIFAVAFDTVDTNNVEVVKSGSNPAEERRVRARNMTIYNISGGSKSGFAPISIGFTLGFLSFVGSSVSGGAYNPARAFGPSLIGGIWEDHWLYWIAGFSGSAAAGYMQMIFGHRNRNVLELAKSIIAGIRDSNLPEAVARRLRS